MPAEDVESARFWADAIVEQTIAAIKWSAKTAKRILSTERTAVAKMIVRIYYRPAVKGMKSLIAGKLLVNQSACSLSPKVVERRGPRTRQLISRLAVLETLEGVGIYQQPQVTIDLPIGWI